MSGPETTVRPHPAEGMVARVECGDGAVMCFAAPTAEQTLGWSLTWATNVEPFRLSAAAVISSYDYLLSSDITTAEATRRLRLLRAKRREYANGRRPVQDHPFVERIDRR